MEEILIVEDEQPIAHVLTTILSANGYHTLQASTGTLARSIINSHCPRLILLDLGLPDMEGLELLRWLRGWSGVPVLVVSAREEEGQKVEALDLGADDYITKPFVPLEAMARVNSNIRRFYQLGTKGSGQEFVRELVVRDLRLDLESCMLYRAEAVIELTSVEFKIMKLFMENPGKVFTKQQIFEQGWEEEYMISDNNVMVCISKLRSKLDTEDREYIRTIRGLGYRLEKE